jgi:oxalate decarboxylase/phosphoglucose isomerase-like protein (cupin superfamily)
MVSVLVLVGCDNGPDKSTAAPTSTTVAAATTPVVRDILANEDDPPGAPGRLLSVVRYTIAPGAQLPAHIHPGIQLASIQSGTLTYTVISGTAEVKRGATATGESITGPATTTLGPGDSVTETGDMVHFGANNTNAPVVIIASLLTEDGQDLAITVPVSSTSVPVTSTSVP